MTSTVFTPMMPVAQTGMQLRDKNDGSGEKDTYVGGKMTLFPSPAAGTGNRRFLLCHVLVHVTSLILAVAFIAETGEHSMSNQIEGDYFASILSLLLLLAGVVGIIGLSLSAKNPFKYSIVLAFIFWAFVGAFASLILAFSSLAGSLANSHSARVLGLFCALSQSLGIAFVFAGMIGGLASAIVQFPFLDAKPGNAI